MHQAIKWANCELESQVSILAHLYAGHFTTHSGRHNTTDEAIAGTQRRIRELMSMLARPQGD